MRQGILLFLLAGLSIALAGCAGNDTTVGRFQVGKPYNIAGKTYYPQESYASVQTGVASWYGPGFHGKKTANGERFDQNALTAAHPTLQLPSLVRVTNLENNRTLIVRVNDRGPFHGGRVMDLSKAAAEELGFRNKGTAQVRLQVLGPESMAIASAARHGVDTRGAEIAMNNTGRLDERFAAYYPTTVSAPDAPVMVAADGYQPNLPMGAQVAVATPLSVPSLTAPPVPPQTPRAPQLAMADSPAVPLAPVESTPLAQQGAVYTPVSATVPAQAPTTRAAAKRKTIFYQMSPIAEANAAETVPHFAPAHTLALPMAASAP